MTMKNKLKTWLCYMMVLFFSSNTIKAQNKEEQANDSTIVLRSANNSDPYLPTLPTVTYPTPTSMEFQKYLGYPVSHATGLVDISIPLYDFEEKFVTLPFMLKYHSAGRKINDSPGAIGYGWTLHPGLKIYRTIMGKPDDGYPVKSLSLQPSIKELVYMATPASDRDYQYSMLSEDLKFRRDGQSDIFTILLPHTSASFIIEFTGTYFGAPGCSYNVTMLHDSPLIIKPSVKYYDQIGSNNLFLFGFTVTDEYGNIYSFGEETYKNVNSLSKPEYIEHTKHNGGESLDVAIGWMLRKIVQPNDEEILFTYTDLLEYDSTPQSNIQIIDEVLDYNGAYGEYTVEIATALQLVDYNGWKMTDNHVLPSSFINSKTINTINSNTKEMIFLYSNTLEGSKSLSKITVKDKLLNNVIKTFFLTMKGTDRDNRSLTEVEVSGAGKYTFTYNPFSSYGGFDWWGYMNGTPNTNISIPKFQVYCQGFTPNQSGNKPVGNSNVDRNPSLVMNGQNWGMLAGALTKITYPTGGSFGIEYQCHNANYNGTFRDVGGLRVWKTHLYNPESNQTVTKEYFYEKPHTTISEYPTPESLMKTSTICMVGSTEVYAGFGFYKTVRDYIRARMRVVSQFSPHSYYSANACPVWYEKVTEYENEGKTIYTYEYKPTDIKKTIGVQNQDCYYYPSVVNHLQTAPRLLSKTHYHANGRKLQTINHTYTTDTRSMTRYIVMPVKILHGALEYSQCDYFGYSRNSDFLCTVDMSPEGSYSTYELVHNIFGNPIAYGNYDIKHGSINISSIETITYTYNTGNNSNTPNDSIVEQISYTYDTGKRYNLRTKTVLTNMGDLTETYYYPYDNLTIPDKNTLTSTQQSNISLMDGKNYKTAVIQQILKKGNSTLFSKITGFMNIPNKPELFLPETDYFRETPHSLYGGINLTFEPRIRYHSYDQYGNPTCVSYENGSMMVYIWGYKGQYPVAKIESSSNLSSFYTTVTTAIGTTNINILAGNPTDTLIRSIFTTLRGNSSMTGALITSYTYKPLVGITSETDPSGRTIFYEYDSFGRLIRVKDDAGKILKEHNYNYAQ